MTQVPTDEEAIEAVRRIKATIESKLQADREGTRKKNKRGCIITMLLFLLGVVISYASGSIWMGLYFYALLGVTPHFFKESIVRHHCGERADEDLLIAFAQSRNWFHDVWKEFRNVEGSDKRKMFYTTPKVLDLESIIRRINQNDLLPRPVPPTGEVPRSKPNRSTPHQKVEQPTPKPRDATDKSPSDSSKPENPEENVIPRTERAYDIPEILMGERRRLEELRQAEAAKSSEGNVVEPPHGLPSPPAAPTPPTEQGVPKVKPPAPEQPIGNPLKRGANRVDSNKPLPPAKPGEPPKRVIEANEGGRVLLKRYAPVRDPRLRAEAIAMHGKLCCVCGFDFNEVYGEDLAQDYIEVHHLKPVGDGERKTNAHTDLAPLCGNCHVMADRLLTVELFPPETIEELRAVFEKRRRVQRLRNRS